MFITTIQVNDDDQIQIQVNDDGVEISTMSTKLEDIDYWSANCNVRDLQTLITVLSGALQELQTREWETKNPPKL